MKHFVRTLCTVALIAFTAHTHAADQYPTKPIRLVVTFPSGGAPDTLARIFSEKAQLGQSVVVDNKPGANGIIGMQDVQRSKPDGYTFMFAHVGAISIGVIEAATRNRPAWSLPSSPARETATMNPVSSTMSPWPLSCSAIEAVLLPGSTTTVTSVLAMASASVAAASSSNRSAIMTSAASAPPVTPG